MRNRIVGKWSGQRSQMREQMGEAWGSTTPEFVDFEKISTNVVNVNIVNDLEPAVITNLYTLDLISENHKNDNIKSRFTKLGCKGGKSTDLVQLRSSDPWADWFIKTYGQEMGDAFEPDIMLPLAEYGLIEQILLDPTEVCKAGAIMRSRGDRSFLALMTPKTITDWVWTMDPQTNKWSSRAKFSGE